MQENRELFNRILDLLNSNKRDYSINQIVKELGYEINASKKSQLYKKLGDMCSLGLIKEKLVENNNVGIKKIKVYCSKKV